MSNATISEGLWRNLESDLRQRIEAGTSVCDVMVIAAGLATFLGLEVDSDWVGGSGSYVKIYSPHDGDETYLQVLHRDGKAVLRGEYL